MLTGHPPACGEEDKGGTGMKEQAHIHETENRENDFVDAMFSAGVSSAIFFGIFIVFTVIAYLK
jgi:uncharacterized membrane protein